MKSRNPPTSAKVDARVDTAIDVVAMIAHHGSAWQDLARELGVDAPELPEAVAVCTDTARPGYTTIDASEYRDTPRVLEAKVGVPEP